jgi:hypothetical protein
MSSLNVNLETGVRYGVIALNNIDSDTAQWLWTEGENISEREALDDLQLDIEEAIAQEIAAGTLDVDTDVDDEARRRFERSCDCLEIDEPHIEGEYDDIKYAISWLGGAPLLWMLKSPHTTYANLCSPCVPNAGNLDSLNSDGYECYDVPPDWRV